VKLFSLIYLLWASPSFTPAITIDQIFAKLNVVAKSFHSIEVDVERTHVTVIANLNDKTVSSGKLYYMRGTGKEPHLKVHFLEPEQYFWVDKGKAVIYTPKTKQADEYSIGNKASAVDQFMALGFGQSSEDLKANFQVSLRGEEAIDGKKTALLELTPKTTMVAIKAVQIWVDEQNGIALQIKLTELSGDYAIYKYSNIKLGSVPASTFEIRFPKDVHVNKL